MRFAAIAIMIFFIVLCAFVLDSFEPHAISLIQRASIMPDKGINYQIDRELIILIDDLELVVDAGFETDLASIPRILWPIFYPGDDALVYPAIVHDYLYSCGFESRKFADDVLFSYMQASGVPKIEAAVFYLVVRLFGQTHFKNDGYCEVYEHVRKITKTTRRNQGC